MNPEPTVVSSTAASPDVPAGSVLAQPKISLRKVLKSAPHHWKFAKILRDGHCFFHSFVLALNNLKIPSCPTTSQQLREACAKQLHEWNGVIPGLRAQLFEDGQVLYQGIRGEKERLINIDEYCSLLRTSMYGGFEEMQMIAQMYKVQVFVYSLSIGNTCENLVPLPILMDNDFPADHAKNAGNSVAVARSHFSLYHLGPKIHVLLELGRGKAGVADHTTLMHHPHSRHAECMLSALEVDVDYRVVQTKYGRGLQSLKRHGIDVCTGWYDGHRVDEKGSIVMRRPAITALMRQYPLIDRELQKTPFQTTHAVRLGRRHESGLLVDGGPLAHPCLDHVKGIGRMSLANSGSPKDSNM